MRSFQLLVLALLAMAARADHIFIEGQIDTALTFCDMEDDRCPALGTPSGLGGIIVTNLWGNWSRTVDSAGYTTFNDLDNPLIGISVRHDFIWYWFNEFDGYSWTLMFPDNTFKGLNGSGTPIDGSLFRMMQYGELEYKVTGGFVTMRHVPEPASLLLLVLALGFTILIRSRHHRAK